MRRATTVALMLTALVGSPGAGYADAVSAESFHLRTAQDLLDLCSVKPGESDYEASLGFCFGYIEGGGHYHDAITSGPEHARLICTDGDATREQVVAVLVTYLGANPQHLADPPMETLVRAAMVEWPCDAQVQ